MKTRIPIVASAIVLSLGLALTGCSGGGLAGGTSGGGTSGSGGSGSGGGGSNASGGNSGPQKSYSADDLVTILKKTEAARGLSGSIKDDSQIKSDQGDLKNDLSTTLTANGGKIVPSVCGPLLDQLIKAGNNELLTKSWTGASLEATNDIIDLGATSDLATANSALSTITGVMSQLTAKCGSMKIVEGSVSVGFTIKNASFSTNASKTFGYEEDIAIPGTKTVSKTLTVEAIYGNLFIGDVSVDKANVSNMEANVNAVIDAAKG